MPVAYFMRGGGESWAVIRLIGRDEQIVADDLSKEAAIERCYALLEELSRGVVIAELPLDGDNAPRRRPRQLSFKF